MDTALAEMPIIDIDSHFTEPPDLWAERAPAALKDLAPRVVEIEGKPCWVAGRDVLLSPPGFCVVRADGSKVLGKVTLETFEEMTPAASRAKERLEKMDELGLTLQVVYPNVLGFAGATVMNIDDVAVRNFCISGYNDGVAQLQIDSGGRLFPQALIPFWDADLAVKELIRCHDELGLTGFTMPDNMAPFSLPALHESHWDGLWSTAQERGLPCNFHIGSGGIDPTISWQGMRLDRWLASMSTLVFMNNARCIVNLIFSGLLDRFPSLNFVSVESGIGYIPFLLESCEYQLNENTLNGADLALRPWEYFRRQIYASYWFERDHTPHSIEAVGEDNVMFETDFPHPTCLYPSVREQVQASLEGLAPRIQRKVLYETAARVYGLELPSQP
jgi:predicted TIM-barrel fold metal-dependent hydrolase